MRSRRSPNRSRTSRRAYRAATEGLSILKTGLEGFVEGNKEFKDYTCCHYTKDNDRFEPLDKETGRQSRFTSDMILVSNNLESETSKLQLFGEDQGVPEKQDIKDWDFKRNVPNGSGKILPWDNTWFSDHAPVRLNCRGINIVSCNVSFALLHAQYQLFEKNCIDLSNPGISEELVVNAYISRQCGDFPFLRFVKKARDERVHVLLFQEWPTELSDNAIDGQTNEWAKNILKQHGYDSFFETQSGIEGSGIFWNQEAFDQKNISIIRPTQASKDPYWSWCGILGRAWSYIEIHGTAEEAAPIYCLNVHGPSSSDGRVKKLDEVIGKAMQVAFCQPFGEKKPERNKFAFAPVEVTVDFMNETLSGLSGEKIILGGDMNDNHNKPWKKRVERNMPQIII